jgi:hypothetical protein
VGRLPGLPGVSLSHGGGLLQWYCSSEAIITATTARDGFSLLQHSAGGLARSISRQSRTEPSAKMAVIDRVAPS